MLKLQQMFVLFVGFISALEIVPHNPVVEYYNPKYIKTMKFFVRKISRRSPYLFAFNVTTLAGAGNNLTIHCSLLENLSGRYQPMAIEAQYKLCDFFQNEPYLGQMYAKQFPKNWTCPFKAGEYSLQNVVIHLENFPYKLPFTWGSYSVSTRADVEGFLTNTKEKVFSMKTTCTIIQKPTKVNKN